MGTVSSLRWEKTRWIVVSVPNEEFAQQAKTDLETVTNMFFNACLRDRSSELNIGKKQRMFFNGGGFYDWMPTVPTYVFLSKDADGK